MAWDTADNIINDAAVELGLISADLSDPFDSTDQNIVLLCRLLKGLGQDLLRDFPWSHLQKTYTFSTSNGVGAYVLPSDYDRNIDLTYWNRTATLPLAGPVPPQSWQWLKAHASTGTAFKIFRIFNDEFNLHPTPTATETIAYEYISRYWVKESGETSPNEDVPDDGTDTLYMDRRLLIAGLKLYFQRRKGFDSSAEQLEYEDALARAQGKDGAAPVLNLNGFSVYPDRLLNGSNFPDTGYGS